MARGSGGEIRSGEYDRRTIALSVKEFDRAAEKYESGHAGVYELCKKDYPPILDELEKEPFETLLDCGCGTAPMLSLLSERYPERRYTGIDLSPNMIAAARAKGLKNASFVLGNCERLPFADDSFDAVICSQSFYHYPDPQSFFNSVFRVLRPGGRLILRDMTMSAPYGVDCEPSGNAAHSSAGTRGRARLHLRGSSQTLRKRGTDAGNRSMAEGPPPALRRKKACRRLKWRGKRLVFSLWSNSHADAAPQG